MKKTKNSNSTYARFADSKVHRPMTVDEATVIIESTIQAVELCLLEPKTSGARDDKSMTSTVFLLSHKAKPAKELLEQHLKAANPELDENKKLAKLIDDYKKNMASAVNFIQDMKDHNEEMAKSINFPKRLNELAQKSDTMALKKYLVDFHAQPKVSDLSHALRYAANAGQVNNIKVLVKAGGSILNQGPTSGKIALHYAISKGHPAVVRELLISLNSIDYFDPVRQLQQPDANGKTPLDNLFSLTNLTVKNEIRQEIIFALNWVESQDYEYRKSASLSNIKKALEKPFADELTLTITSPISFQV